MIKNIPNAIIDIPKGAEFKKQKPLYTITIKEGKRVIYHNKTYSAVMNIVQGVTKLDIEKLELDGDSQVIAIGHPIVILFAMDQLRKKLATIGIIDKARELLEKITGGQLR